MTAQQYRFPTANSENGGGRGSLGLRAEVDIRSELANPALRLPSSARWPSWCRKSWLRTSGAIAPLPRQQVRIEVEPTTIHVGNAVALGVSAVPRTRNVHCGIERFQRRDTERCDCGCPIPTRVRVRRQSPARYVTRNAEEEREPVISHLLLGSQPRGSASDACKYACTCRGSLAAARMMRRMLSDHSTTTNAFEVHTHAVPISPERTSRSSGSATFRSGPSGRLVKTLD